MGGSVRCARYDPCVGCPNNSAYRILGIFDDYIWVGCPCCGQEFGLSVGQDHDL